MPRARFTSPYFGNGMNNLVEALSGDPLMDAKAGLVGDRRKLTQAQERDAMAQALLGELEHGRTQYNDQLAVQGAGGLPNMHPALAELGLRGGGNTDQMSSGISALLGADAALGGDPYLSLNLQGKMPDENYSPSAGRADAVSARNAQESYDEAEMKAGSTLAASLYGADRRHDASVYGHDQGLEGDRLRAGATEESARIRAESGGSGRRTTSFTDFKNIQALVAQRLARELQTSGFDMGNEEKTAEFVLPLADLVAPEVVRLMEADPLMEPGLALDTAIREFMQGGYVEQSEPNSVLGMDVPFTGGDPMFDRAQYGADQLGVPLDPQAGPAQAPAPGPQQPQPAPSPVVNAMTEGAASFNDPAQLEGQIADFYADPAQQNMSHEGPEMAELPPVASRQDKMDAMEAALDAIDQGGNANIILNKLGMMGLSESELARFREVLEKNGLLPKAQ